MQKSNSKMNGKDFSYVNHFFLNFKLRQMQSLCPMTFSTICRFLALRFPVNLQFKIQTLNSNGKSWIMICIDWWPNRLSLNHARCISRGNSRLSEWNLAHWWRPFVMFALQVWMLMLALHYQWNASCRCFILKWCYSLRLFHPAPMLFGMVSSCSDVVLQLFHPAAILFCRYSSCSDADCPEKSAHVLMNPRYSFSWSCPTPSRKAQKLQLSCSDYQRSQSDAKTCAGELS